MQTWGKQRFQNCQLIGDFHMRELDPEIGKSVLFCWFFEADNLWWLFCHSTFGRCTKPLCTEWTDLIGKCTRSFLLEYWSFATLYSEFFFVCWFVPSHVFCCALERTQSKHGMSIYTCSSSPREASVLGNQINRTLPRPPWSPVVFVNICQTYAISPIQFHFRWLQMGPNDETEPPWKRLLESTFAGTLVTKRGF